MNITDPISDMLTRIRNAGKAGLKVVRIPGSKMKIAIAEILKKEGFIEEFTFTEDNKQGEVEIILKYDEYRDPVISGLKRISKPGLRKYVNKGEVPTVLRKYGIAILSTSVGVISDRQAKKLGVGGEVLCYVW